MEAAAAAKLAMTNTYAMRGNPAFWFLCSSLPP